MIILITLILVLIILITIKYIYGNNESFQVESDIISEENDDLLPSEIKLSGKSGNKYIQLFWQPPNKGYETLKEYVIVIKNTKTNNIKMYYHDNLSCKTCSYIINNLENNIEYNSYIISVNEFGVGPKSNTLKLMPFSGKIIPKPIKKNINITCLKNGNFLEDTICRKNETIEPNIDIIEYQQILDKLKNSQNNYNFDLKL